MNKPTSPRGGTQPQAAPSLSDFFGARDFCFYRNYCFHSTIPDPQRSVVLYDQSCPICRREMHRLKARDRHHRLALIDISASRFDPHYWGFPLADLSASLHVQQPDGQWLTGMAAVRHVYTQVGLGCLVAPSGWPLLSRLADHLYARIAPNRQALSHWLGLSSRPPCNDDLCDSGTAADANPTETSNAVQSH